MSTLDQEMVDLLKSHVDVMHDSSEKQFEVMEAQMNMLRLEQERGRKTRNAARSLLAMFRADNCKGLDALLAENPWLEKAHE